LSLQTGLRVQLAAAAAWVPARVRQGLRQSKSCTPLKAHVYLLGCSVYLWTCKPHWGLV
jgi:hypothetical protein